MAENNFVNIKIQINDKYKNVQIEKGVSFENNGAKYLVDENGVLQKLDKSTNIWTQASHIQMTNYQFKAFQAIADNDKNSSLSKDDITSAMKQYSNSELSADIQKELPMGYKIEKHDTGYTNKLKDGVEFGIAYQDNHQVSLKFQFTDNKTTKASNQSQVAENSKIEYKHQSTVPEILQDNLFKSEQRNGKYKNIEYMPPEVYEVQNGDSLDKIRIKYKLDFFELLAANPDIKYDVEYSSKDQAKITVKGYLHKGDKINIPARYKIKPGSVKNLNDVIKATGVSEDYVNDILLRIEPQKAGKPDLKAYYDKVNGEGKLTIGFGHTGRDLSGKPLTPETRITEKEAYELLAQDILDAKVRTISYLEQNGISKEDFDKIPLSLQSIIVDVTFNKGVYDGFENEHHEYTNMLKHDLNNKDYGLAAAHTIRLSNVIGLEKRSGFRFITSLKDLTDKDLITAKDNSDKDINKIIARMAKRDSLKAETKELQKLWNNVVSLCEKKKAQMAGQINDSDEESWFKRLIQWIFGE